MIFKKIEKVVGLRQPAGRDYGLSIEYRLYCQKLGKSSHGEIRPKMFDFVTGLVSRYGDFPNFWVILIFQVYFSVVTDEDDAVYREILKIFCK